MSLVLDHLLSIIVLAPFAGCLLLLALPPEWKTASRVVALVSGGISLALSCVAWALYDGAKGGFQFRESYQWIPGLDIRYSLGADGISLSMLLLTGVIIVTGVFASWTLEERCKEFLTLLLFLVTGVFGVFVALDLFFLFLFYEIAVLPMYLLIGIWGTGRKEYSAMKLTLYLMLGSAFILTGILALYYLDPRRTFDMLELSGGSELAVGLQRALFFAFYLGFGVLAGIFPFHTWSPDGHASAPTAVSMLHAGVLMKLGAYGVIRTCVAMFPEVAPSLMPIVAAIAAINIVYGAFSALGQTDLKYVIAYSSVSHMGVVMLGIASLAPVGMAGAVMQMFSHGIMTGLFFALVGLVYQKAHTRDILAMGGFARRMPGIAVAFTVGGLASFGLPGTSGFVAETLVFLGTFARYPVIVAVAVTGVVITAVYVLRVVQKVFLGPLGEAWSELPDARSTEWVALVSLAALLVAVGVWPMPLVNLINHGLRTLGMEL
ncbi:MAG: NADH-quinone oxidoreductase subunit M [Fimbriimonadales bacterium]|nr:NADH-quinone oxidoreductase subunit M [Fimbriimonadales bacterium]